MINYINGEEPDRWESSTALLNKDDKIEPVP